MHVSIQIFLKCIYYIYTVYQKTCPRQYLGKISPKQSSFNTFGTGSLFICLMTVLESLTQIKNC